MPRDMGHNIGTPEPVHLVHQNNVEFLLAGIFEKPFSVGPVFKRDRARYALIAVDAYEGDVLPLTPGVGKVNLCLNALALPLLLSGDAGIEHSSDGRVAVAAR